MSDYEIDEIRRIRHQISAEHDHDLRKVADYYRNVEQELRQSGRYKFIDEQPQQPHPDNIISAT
ncbi:MAG: hypothetical protein ISR77_18890 [Pirellulaceae bacterium]|nr:hypothetical protein [Pirellulaceae bacterium]